MSDMHQRKVQLYLTKEGQTKTLTGELPQAVEDFAIGVNSQHDIVSGSVMCEGLLRVDKKHVGYPDFLHQAAIKSHALVVIAFEGQTLIFPVVPQIKGHGEVLK